MLVRVEQLIDGSAEDDPRRLWKKDLAVAKGKLP
jgi:hypothetical protein